jgi:hypothetical protein
MSPVLFTFYLLLAEHLVGYLRQRLEGRPGKIEALEEGHAVIPQPVILARLLHSFCHDIDGKAFADLGDARKHALLDRAVMDVTDQLPVELDIVRLVFDQQLQAGITRPEIVDGGPEAKVLDELQVFDQVALVGQVVGFQHLEDDVLHRDAAVDGGLESGGDIQVDLVKSPRREVQAEQVGDLQLASQVDGFAPQHFVEPGEVRERHLGEHRRRGLSVRPAHQGFEGHDFPVGCVHNGLKGETEVETDIPTRSERSALFDVSMLFFHYSLPECWQRG